MKKMSKHKSRSILSGVAGEYFVAAELSRMGYIASITLRNSQGVDILCSNSSATKSVGIQVKTCSGGLRTWVLNEKAENYYSPNLFYIFVCLNQGKESPDYFVVPSRVVSKHVTFSHKKWLATPGRHGQKHKDNPMRKFRDDQGKYLNQWNLLGLK